MVNKSTTNASTRTFMAQPVAETTKPARSYNPLRKKNLPWLIVLVLLVGLIFLFTQYRQAQTKLSAGSQQYYGSQTKKLSQLIVLPTGETPTVITVKDVTKLRGQAFYANAQNGDITFVYAKTRKAILYRPSRNIIVNVAPVSASSDQSQ